MVHISFNFLTEEPKISAYLTFWHSVKRIGHKSVT